MKSNKVVHGGQKLVICFSCNYRPQTKFAKVMFSQVSVCPRGGGHAWQGACVAGRHAWQGEHAWWGGACMAGGMHGGGACMVGGG